MAIIFIALLHAAPVFLIGLYKRSRGWLIATAIGSGILAASFGSEKYLYVDLLAIGVTVIWCWIALAPAYPKVDVLEQKPGLKPPEPVAHEPVHTNDIVVAPRKTKWFSGIAWALGGSLVVWKIAVPLLIVLQHSESWAAAGKNLLLTFLFFGNAWLLVFFISRVIKLCRNQGIDAPASVRLLGLVIYSGVVIFLALAGAVQVSYFLSRWSS